MITKSKEDKIYNYLIAKYKKAVLTKSELSVEMGVCKSTIDKYIAKDEGVPQYKKLGSAKNARVIFSIVDVARFLNN